MLLILLDSRAPAVTKASFPVPYPYKNLSMSLSTTMISQVEIDLHVRRNETRLC